MKQVESFKAATSVPETQNQENAALQSKLQAALEGEKQVRSLGHYTPRSCRNECSFARASFTFAMDTLEFSSHAFNKSDSPVMLSLS